jgi:tetratricopeptide (TPR) repeat protein
MIDNLDFANNLIKQGDYKYKNNDINGAILAYTSAIEISPNYYLAFLKRAQAKCATNKVDYMLESYEDFTKVIELKPSNADAYEGRGALGMTLSPDDPSNQDDFDKAIEFGSNNFMLYWNIGISKLQNNDFEGMLIAFTQFLKYPVGDNYKGEAFYFKALANMKLGDFRNAIIDFTFALNNNVTKNLAWTYFNRTVCYQKFNDLNEALVDINSFLELTPNHIDGLHIRAQIYSSLNLNNDALHDYSIIVELDSQNMDALIQRSKIYFLSDQNKDAMKDYLLLMGIEPTNAIYPFSVGVCLTKLEQYDEAIYYYNIALNIDDKYKVAYHYRGICHLYLGNSQACHDFRVASSLGFENSDEYIEKYCKS